MTKRFYKEAAVAADDGGYGVALDGRPVRTPGGAPLTVPAKALAEAIAAEWREQGDEIRPLAMPLMRLAATAIDRIGREREAIAGQIAAYGGSDLLCYRAAEPAGLVARQTEHWQPLLDWAAEEYGARLAVANGVSPVAQDAAALAALARAVERHDDFHLAGLSQLTAACGSLVLALAVVARRIGADQAVAACQLDEDWQAKKWGRDDTAAERREALAREIMSVGRFLELLQDAPTRR